MMNCKEIARLVSESHDRPLSALERVKIRLHLMMCFVCRRFSKQLELISKLTRVLGNSDSNSLVAEGGVLGDTLSADAKSRIKDVLSKES